MEYYIMMMYFDDRYLLPVQFLRKLLGQLPVISNIVIKETPWLNCASRVPIRTYIHNSQDLTKRYHVEVDTSEKPRWHYYNIRDYIHAAAMHLECQMADLISECWFSWPCRELQWSKCIPDSEGVRKYFKPNVVKIAMQRTLVSRGDVSANSSNSFLTRWPYKCMNVCWFLRLALDMSVTRSRGRTEVAFDICFHYCSSNFRHWNIRIFYNHDLPALEGSNKCIQYTKNAFPFQN